MMALRQPVRDPCATDEREFAEFYECYWAECAGAGVEPMPGGEIVEILREIKLVGDASAVSTMLEWAPLLSWIAR